MDDLRESNCGRPFCVAAFSALQRQVEALRRTNAMLEERSMVAEASHAKWQSQFLTLLHCIQGEGYDVCPDRRHKFSGTCDSFELIKEVSE